MTRSKRPSMAVPSKLESRKVIGQRAGEMATRLQELERELQGKLPAKREGEIRRILGRVWEALKAEMEIDRMRRALVVHIVEQEADSMWEVEQKARATGRPRDHDPVELVRERISLVPGAENALDTTILKAVSACAQNRSGRDASVKWAALADLCVEIGLAVDDKDTLRMDYEQWKRESAPKRGKK